MILSLDSAAAQDAARAGNKGSTLARLRAAGFPVPEGFIVTSEEDGAALVREFLHDLEVRLGPDARFAVRSSGGAEDSVHTSFAGQYETVLGVRGFEEVARAIAHCFASFSGGRALAYKQGLGVRDSGGAVIVQRLVDAEAAGVAFTVDPVSGARDRVLIDASIGLGDAVAGGRITPDSFVVLNGTGEIVGRRIAGARPSLDDDAVRAVAELARRVDDHHGGPVDIEWARHGGRTYLLQSRAITAMGSRADEAPAPPPGWAPELNTRIDPRFPVYSNGNVSEILPGCVTPLTYSLFSRGVERAFRDLAESIGSMSDVGPEPIVVGFFFHRIYLNVSYFMTAADHSPGASRDTVYEDLIGPPTEHHPAWTIGDLLPWRLWRGLRIMGRYLALQRRLDADIAGCRTHYELSRQRLDQIDPLQWPNEELVAWLMANDAGLQPAIVHIRASQFATSSFATLRSMTRTWLGDATGSLASSLVTGIGSIAGAGPAAGLCDLARRVAADPAMLALFEDEPDDTRLLERLQADEGAASTRLAAEVSAFIARFGHRGFREAELRSPTWRERPAAVVAHVRKQLEPGSVSHEAVARRQRGVSADARARALARLPVVKRALFESILTSTRRHIAAREEMKDLLLRFLDLTRRVIAATTPRLTHVLVVTDDIYFLLDCEVAGALRGDLTPDAVGDIVRRRRQEFEWSSRVEVPKVQEGAARFLTGRDPAPAAALLAGVPVSPGFVEGRARVVLDPSHAVMQPGDILVAPVTDVGWTPLFLRSAGLVVEVGGPLSHGSIVAREYGIPAVTAVAGATRRIRSGDLLRVDGTHGVVAIVGEA